LDKALSKHGQSHGQKQGQSTVGINIQETRNKKQETNIESKDSKELALNKKNPDIDILISELKNQADIL